jgi:MFS family permease
MWTMLIIALVQMPSLALSPAIHLIQTQAFPERTLAQVQTVMGMTNLFWPLTSAVVVFLINRGFVTKKGAVVFGLVLLAVTGLYAIVQHDAFWNLFVLSALLGISCGCFVTNAFGLLFDNFDDEMRQRVAGFQTSSINLGGILFSLAGGMLATAMWYGGYLVLLLGLPVAVLALFTVPHYKSPSAKISGSYTEKSKFNPRIFYYAAITFLFLMIYTVCSTNISTHIEKLGDSVTSGILVAVQMGGGVLSGLFFRTAFQPVRRHGHGYGLRRCLYGVAAYRAFFNLAGPDHARRLPGRDVPEHHAAQMHLFGVHACRHVELGDGDAHHLKRRAQFRRVPVANCFHEPDERAV